jgi:hypothetical protein
VKTAAADILIEQEKEQQTPDCRDGILGERIQQSKKLGRRGGKHSIDNAGFKESPSPTQALAGSMIFFGS